MGKEILHTMPAEKEVPVSVDREIQPRFVHTTLTPGAQTIAARELCDHKGSAPLLSTAPATMSGKDGRSGISAGEANTAETVSTNRLRSP